jgi:hypothetical protein
MKLTPWDHLVLFVTGSLPKKTQIEFDKHEAKELDALRSYIADIRRIAAEEEAALAKFNAEATKGLVKDKATSSTSKKKATTKKPSK